MDLDLDFEGARPLFVFIWFTLRFVTFTGSHCTGLRTHTTVHTFTFAFCTVTRYVYRTFTVPRTVAFATGCTGYVGCLPPRYCGLPHLVRLPQLRLPVTRSLVHAHPLPFTHAFTHGSGLRTRTLVIYHVPFHVDSAYYTTVTFGLPSFTCTWFCLRLVHVGYVRLHVAFRTRLLPHVTAHTTVTVYVTHVCCICCCTL